MNAERQKKNPRGVNETPLYTYKLQIHLSLHCGKKIGEV